MEKGSYILLRDSDILWYFIYGIQNQTIPVNEMKDKEIRKGTE